MLIHVNAVARGFANLIDIIAGRGLCMGGGSCLVFVSVGTRILALLVLFVSGLLPASAVAGEAVSGQDTRGAQAEEEVADLWYFRREGCPVCERAEVWLESFEDRYSELTVHQLDIGRDPLARDLFVAMLQARDERPHAVPTFVYRDHVWVGFSPAVGEAIEAAVGEDTSPDEPGVAVTRLDLGPLGSVELSGQPMLAATMLIAFVDGFNPCSLWVLTVLLAMILGTRSRPRIAAVGLTFLTVTAAIYGLFIAGVFTVLAVMGHLEWIRPVIALLAFLFGAVNVKDYFAFKSGLSLSIPDRFKPSIYRGGRALRGERTLPALLGITVVLAAGVAIVELPCTAGFPVIWTGLVSEAGIEGVAFAALLSVYLLVYLSVEVAILAIAVLTLRPSRMQERHGRVLKLFGGMLMIALATVLLLDPTLMERLDGALLAVGGGLAAAGLILLLHRWWQHAWPQS